MAKLKDGTRVYGDATVDQTLTVGNIAITGNLIVQGTTTSIDTTVTRVEDPIFELGGGANGAALTGADGKERGILLHYYDGSAKDAFMGWHTTNGQFEFGSVATETSGNITVGTYGNLKANVFFGDGGGLSNINGGNVNGDVAAANYANYAGTVTGSAQSNITSLGNLTSFQVGDNTTTGNVVIDTNGVVTATGNISSGGSLSATGNLTIGKSSGPGANTAVANIYGDLNVTGNLNGRFTGTIGAKGSNTQVQFNDNGDQNATSGFTFTKSSNTVGIANVSIAGNDGNINVTGLGRIIGSTGVNVKATTGALNLTADGKDLTIDNSGVSYNNNFNVSANGNLTANGYATIAANISTGGGNFTVSTAGAANAANITLRNLANAQIPYTDSSKLVTGSDNFTYDASNQVLKVGGGGTELGGDSGYGYIKTKDANITGNITTQYTSGKLLTTDGGGNLIESNVAFSSNTLNVANANITNTATIANLNITSLTTTGGLLFTGGASGNVTESATLTFTAITNTLSTTNITASGNVVAAKVTANNLTATQLVFAGADKDLTSDSHLTFTTATNTLSTTNITASGNVIGDRVTANNVSDTEIAYANIDHTLVGSASFTYNAASSTLSAPNVVSSSSITGAKVSANNIADTQIAYANIDHTLVGATSFTYTASTSTLSVGNVSATSNVTAANVFASTVGNSATMLYGNGQNITGVTASSIDAGNLTGTTLAATVVNSSLTGFGTLRDVTMGGANSISGGNLLSANYITGTLTTASQPNVTSLGILTSLSSNGNITINNVANPAAGIKTDNLYYSNGTAWDLQQAAGNDTEIQFNNGDNFDSSANFTFDKTGSGTLTVSGTGNIATINATTVTATTGNITTVNGTTGNITTVNATTVTATTGNITTVNATTGNITTVNATDITASGNANITGWLKAADTVITGNLTVTGTTTSVNTSVSQLTDPLFELGGGANGAPLSTNDAFDRGLYMHTRTAGTNKDLFMGWSSANSEFILAKNVTVSDNVVTVPGANAALQTANLGDLRLANIYAYNANFGGVVFSEGNITLGSGSYLNGNLNGNVSGNFTVTGGAGAIQFADSANTLTSNTNINFDQANVKLTVGNGTTTGKVVANLLTGTLTTASQPNVTSVGTLTSLTVDGGTLSVANANLTIGSSYGIKSDNYWYANGTAIDFQTAAGSATQIQFKSSTGNDLDASANLTFDATNSNLTVNGNIITGTGSGGNISGANVVSATLFSGSGANLTNINGANVSEVATATNVTGSSQGNITSVGTLTSLSVTGTTTVGNLTTGGNVYANTGVVKGQYLYGDGSNITHVTATSMDAGNLTGTTMNSSVITSSLTTVGTLGSLSVTASITAGNVYANAGTIKATTLTGTLSTASQPNITSVGTLTSLTVSNTGGTGNVTVDNLYANSGIIGAQYLKGDGSNITSITGANVTGYVPNANIANVAYAVAAGNITGTTLNSNIVTSSLTTVGTLGSLTVTGDITSTTGNIVAGNIGNATTMLYGNGYNITGVTASSVDAGNLTGTTLAAGVINSSLQTVGTLSGLTANSTINFTAASNVALGAVGNVHITGGTSGQYLQTDGSGTISWSTVELSNIHNGTSNVAVANNGNVTVGIATTASVIDIGTVGMTVTGIITATGNITGANIISNAFVIANGTTAATNAITGAIKTAGGISAQGNIYTGDALGFAHGSGNTDSAAYIKYNATAGSIDFIFN